MKYRRIVSVIIFAVAVAAALGAGILIGRSGQAQDKAQTQIVAQSEDTASEKESDRIAVVNLDEGVSVSGANVNYAQSVSEFPTISFEYSSLEQARSGFESGQYGAYVIIPATFSQSVESINSSPQATFLEYAVNQTYSGKMQYELLYNVIKYAQTLNDNLTYMYLNNILSEFHDAQDSAAGVMENDLKDKEAIDSIEAYDLVALVEVPELRQEENTTEPLDLSQYTEANTQAIQSIDDQYMLCVEEIQQEILTMTETGTRLTELLTDLSDEVAQIDLTVDGQGASIADSADAALAQSLKDYVDGAPDKEQLASQLQSIQDNNNRIKEGWLKSNEIYNNGLKGNLDSQIQAALGAAADSIELTVTPDGAGGYIVSFTDAAGVSVPQLTFTPSPAGQTAEGQAEAGQGATVYAGGSTIECSGDINAFNTFLREKIKNTDLSSYSIGGVQDILYDNNGDVVIGSDGQPKTMSALMDETNALIDEIKEDLEDYEELDIEAVQQLVKDQYIDPIEKNAQTAKESFIQRNNDEKEYIGQYNTAIGEFDPQINAQFVAENIAGMTENNMNQQTALAENNMAYAEYANRVFEAAMENVSALQESIAQTKESSDQAVADALREAKGIKEETSAWNQDVLASFSKKLPYTRLGSAEYTQAYQFIANPVNIEDRSEGNERTVAAASPEVSAPQSEAEEDFPWEAVYIGAGVLILILLGLLVWNSSRRKEGQ